MLLVAIGSLPLADTWGMHDMGTGRWVVMMLFMGLFWAAVILGAMWLVRGVRSRAESRETPAEILKRRLADGTLTPEEYEARRRLLGEDSPTAQPQGVDLSRRARQAHVIGHAREPFRSEWCGRSEATG